MIWFLALLIALHKCNSLVTAAELPADINKCRFGNNSCIRDSINQIIRRYPKGLKQFNLLPLDEFRPEDYHLMDQPHVGALWISFRIFNPVVGGCENATVTEVSGFERDPTKEPIEIKVRIPRIEHHSDYSMQLRWLNLVRANTTGKCFAELQNVSLTLNLKVTVNYQNGKRYLKIYHMVPEVVVGRFMLRLDDLYKENFDLTQVVNQVYNDNWLELWNEIEPKVAKAYARQGTELLDRIFAKVAYDDMFLPD